MHTMDTVKLPEAEFYATRAADRYQVAQTIYQNVTGSYWHTNALSDYLRKADISRLVLTILPVNYFA